MSFMAWAEPTGPPVGMTALAQVETSGRHFPTSSGGPPTNVVSCPSQAWLGVRESGVSILLIEQNARAALEVSDHAYVLETGAVALQGEAAALARDPRVIDTYLGTRKQ